MLKPRSGGIGKPGTECRVGKVGKIESRKGRQSGCDADSPVVPGEDAQRSTNKVQAAAEVA
jgi:hypothetical protein